MFQLGSAIRKYRGLGVIRLKWLIIKTWPSFWSRTGLGQRTRTISLRSSPPSQLSPDSLCPCPAYQLTKTSLLTKLFTYTRKLSNKTTDFQAYLNATPCGLLLSNISPLCRHPMSLTSRLFLILLHMDSYYLISVPCVSPQCRWTVIIKYQILALEIRLFQMLAS